MDKEDKSLEEILIRIELLFQTAINELKENNETDVDFDYLSSTLETYSKCYEPQEAANIRWHGYTIELTDLLRKSREGSEDTLRKLLASDKALTAYQTAQYLHPEDEE